VTRTAPAVLALALVASVVARADEPGAGAAGGAAPSAVAPTVIRLSLSDVARLALRNNPEIRRLALEPDVASGELRKALAEFDPALFGEARYTRQKPSPGPDTDAEPDGAASFLSLFSGGSGPSETETSVFAIGVRTKLRTGTKLELEYRAERQRDLSDPEEAGVGLASLFGTGGEKEPSWTNRVELRITQPLLQGAGTEFNTANIRLAEIAKEIAYYDAADSVRRSVSEALLAYWDLVRADGDVKINQASLERAKLNLADVIENVKAGLRGRRQQLNAETGVAQRREPLAVSELRRREVQRRLFKLIMPQDRALPTAANGIVLTPTDSVERAAGIPDASVDAAMLVALLHRPDYLRARKTSDSRHVAYRRARHLLLPKLDLTGRAGYEGKGTTHGDADDQLGGLEFWTWELGLALEVPLGNRAAKGELQRALAQLEQAQIALDDVEQQVRVDVLQALDEIETARERTDLVRASVDASQRQYDEELDRFKKLQDLELKTVLDYEEDLSQQRSRLLQAQTDLQRARIALARAQGRIIEDVIGAPPAR